MSSSIHTLARAAACIVFATASTLALAQGNAAAPGMAKKIQDARAKSAQLRSDLAVVRKTLQARGLPATFIARHDALAAQLDERAQRFDAAVAHWQATGSAASLAEAQALLQPQGRAAPQLPAVLPWGAEQSNTRLPAQTASAWYRILTRDERVQLAQAGLTSVGGIRFTQLPEPGAAPQDADLAETPDIALTPAIRAQAQALGKNPVAIANWVRANVRFTPSWGVTRKADATLQALRGNALETTGLTIALLRASGIPARYQFGTVDVPVAMAANWLGGVERPEAIVQMLQQGGIAARSVTQGAQITAIRMEHAWASAYVNWTHARGARDGGEALDPPQHPSPNAALNAWIPIDASYKPQRITAGMNFAEVAAFNAAAVIASAKEGAVCTASTARQLNLSALQAHHAQFKTAALAQLAAGDPLVGQVMGTNRIASADEPLLSGTLAFPIVASNTAVAALTPALRWKLQLALAQGTQQVLALDKPLAELEGRSLTLGFLPETDADATFLAELLRPPTGGDAATGLPGRIAAYLVRMKAQLRVDGQLVAEGGSFTLGQPLALRILLQNPEGKSGANESTVTVGETHAWSVQGQALAAQSPSAIAQSLASLRTQLQGAQPPGGAEASARILYAGAAAFQASLDAQSRLYQRAAGGVETRLPSATRMSSRLEAEELFGLVTHVRAAGIGLHVDRLGSATAPRAGTSAPGFARLLLERASAQAHQLLDRLYGAGAPGAQSALSGLASAARQNGTVLRADSATQDETLAALDAESTVREPVRTAVANGMQALFTASAADLGAMPMDPLVVMHVPTGSASYSATSRALPLVQLTAQRPGLAGWLGLADADATKALVAAPLEATLGQLNTAQTVLGDIDTLRWQEFPARSDVADGLYAMRIAQAASTAQTCDWLISAVASQLGGGLPPSGPPNRAPVIDSQPVTTATADAPYRYAVQASDADGNALSYSLPVAPTGMTIDAAGLVQWPRAVSGTFPVTVRVSDGQAIAEQGYTLTVAPAGPLGLGIALSPGIANAGQAVTLVATASSANGAVTRTATLDGAPLALDANGQATFAAPASGTHVVAVMASDGRTSVRREAILTVRDAADITPPVAAITAPAADAGIRGRLEVRGSATDANFAYYQLLVRRSGDGAWSEAARSLTPVADGLLGTIDTALYANGPWDVALRVVDVNGAQTTASVTVDFIGNLKLGQVRLAFADIRAEAPGLPLVLTRTYDSTKKDQSGDFGYGWSASAQDIAVRKNVTFGIDWKVEQRQFQSCLVPAGKRRVSITLPDGGLYRFDAANVPQCQSGAVPPVNIGFTAVPGPTGGPAGRTGAAARLKVLMDTSVLAQGGQLIDGASGEVWNPQRFELTTEENFKYVLREGVGVLRVTDPYGNTVDYGPGGYTHSAGSGLSLTRDAQGRITRATDPNGKSLSYAYNAQGELASVTDREGKVTTFGYVGVGSAGDTAHLLASITDARGVQVMANQFDAQGRLTAVADALGQASVQQFDTASDTQTVTDRRGNKTVYTFDADGNITQSVNALGEKTTYTYDANGNETSVTDALGNRTERSFDAQTGKLLAEKNPLGHTSETSYPVNGNAWERVNPLSTKDARGNVTHYIYPDNTALVPGAVPASIAEPLGRSTSIGIDTRGNLFKLDIAGEVLDFEYDAQGRKTAEKNGLGQVTRYTYDALGNETSRTTQRIVNGAPVADTTTRKYDAENRLVEETDAKGGRRTLAYDAAGKLVEETDPANGKTRYTYDANARLIRTDYADSTNEQTAYDAEGNETARTDRLGRTTRMAYDALNRLASTQYPDGTTSSTAYDAAGRVASTTDRQGKVTRHEYDAAGRQTASIDPTGLRTAFTFDESGNRRTVSVNGLTTRFDYDALNRLVLTTYPDGSTHAIRYRPDNRKESETDPRGMVTTYAYDAAGRLVSVSQSGVAGTTRYSYSPTGLKVTQTDALGRTTSWEQDANANTSKRTLPDGTSETSRYDSRNNVVEKKTFAGETVSFSVDSMNRRRGVIVSAGAGANSAVAGTSVSLEYFANGLLKSQLEAGASTLAGTQRYEYDSNDLLTFVGNPIGQMRYEWDAEGRVTAHSRTIGNVDAGTVRYEYDDAGRLVKVTAPDGRKTTYSFDANGRLARIERELASGLLVTHQRFDLADRVIAIAHLKRIGTDESLVIGQAIDRSSGGTVSSRRLFDSTSSYDAATGQFTGAPHKVEEFEYDGNARLTREKVTRGAAIVDTRYEFDLVGNRTKKTMTSAAGADITTYAYDVNDRLKTATTTFAAGGGSLKSYGWDQNGNLASKTEPGKVTLYRFDPQNRLIDIRTGATQQEAVASAPTATYAYDAQGNRIRRGGQNPVEYMIDTTPAYAQVSAEKGAANTTTYVRGHHLIRQQRTGEVASDIYPLFGHLGTSLGAVDANGNAVETIDTNVFGALVQVEGRAQTHLYTGEYWDQDARLYYLRARWYDADLGRFMSADPFEGAPRDPRSLNRYTYAHSDPVHGMDPSGEFTTSEVVAATNITLSMAASFSAGFEAGSIINRVIAGGALLSTDNLKSAAEIALVLVPAKYLTMTADLALVARQLENAGFAVKIYDSTQKGFGAIYHFVQRLRERGIAPKEALEALSRGNKWVDTKTGAFVHVLGENVDGTVKIIVSASGEIVTAYRTKLTKKFRPM